MECQHFMEQLEALSTWVKNTKELLETQKGPVGSVTDHDEQDSVVVDPTVSAIGYSSHCLQYLFSNV